MPTAFEAITEKTAWYAAETLDRHMAAEFDANGKLINAKGAGQFVGIVQYGAENIDDMATVVKGIFPAIGSVEITAGAKVTIDTANPGKFKVATTGDMVYGTALSAAAAGDLFSLAIADVTQSIA